jgi:hypothetical protein
MSVLRPAAVFLLAVTALPRALGGQVVFTGRVIEDGSDRPLQGVQVLIEGTKREASTDAQGRFRLDAPTGNRVALFRLIGYQPFRLRLQLVKTDSTTALVQLVRQQAQMLDSIVTTGSMPAPRGAGLEAFEHRRKLGFGKFIDSTELRRSEGRKLMDLLRAVQGVKLTYYVEDPLRPWEYEWRLASGRSVGADGYCWMSVVMDGAPIYRSGSRSRPPDFRREAFQVASLEAVEIYRSPAEVPLEYGGPAEECGLLLLWTRHQ